jgi:hypothetical protein
MNSLSKGWPLDLVKRNAVLKNYSANNAKLHELHIK